MNIRLTLCFLFLDLKECASNPCHEQADCTEELGSFKCVCKAGFNGDGLSCNGNYHLFFYSLKRYGLKLFSFYQVT